MLSIKQCTLLVLPDGNYGNILDNSYNTVLKCRRHSYGCHISFQKNKYITCGILIERDMFQNETCFEMFELLRIWSISQYLAAPFSHCKAMINNMVHNSGPYFI